MHWWQLLITVMKMCVARLDEVVYRTPIGSAENLIAWIAKHLHFEEEERKALEKAMETQQPAPMIMPEIQQQRAQAKKEVEQLRQRLSRRQPKEEEDDEKNELFDTQIMDLLDGVYVQYLRPVLPNFMNQASKAWREAWAKYVDAVTTSLPEWWQRHGILKSQKRLDVAQQRLILSLKRPDRVALPLLTNSSLLDISIHLTTYGHAIDEVSYYI